MLPAAGRDGRRGLAGDADQKPDASQHDDKIGSAVTEERQGDALVGQRAGDDTDINDGLHSDEKGDAAGEQHAEGVHGVPRDVNPAQQDHQVGRQHREGGRQSQFLADDREDEVSVVFRNKPEFLTAFAEPNSLRAAGAERGHRLPRLHALVEAGFIRMQPRVNALRPHRILRDEGGEAPGQQQHRRGDVQKTRAGDQEHHAADGGEQHGGADIGFLKQQRENGDHPEARIQDARFEPRHRPLEPFAIPRQREDERHLHELGRLQTEPAVPDPSSSAFLRDANVRHPDADQQADRQQEEHPPERFQPAIIDHGGQQAGEEPDAGPDRLHDEEPGFRLAHARAHQHHDAKNQQRENREQQHRCGGLHERFDPE